MLQRVYIETTFVSYLTARPGRDVVLVAHQQITHDWWDQSRADFELCTSLLVLQEAGGGDPQAAQERLVLLKAMILLDTTEAAVKMTVSRLRQRARDLIRDEIAQTVCTAAEVDEEFRALFEALRS